MFKVVFHEDFYRSYTSDPAAAPGRMEAIIEVIQERVEFVKPRPAEEEDIRAVHTDAHIEGVRRRGLYSISTLAAGAAVKAAEIGMKEPCFGVIRPPGHHASANSSWGFCYFNNMAVAVMSLINRNLIESAYILDFDLHYGDGNVNILENRPNIAIFNPDYHDRETYLGKVEEKLADCKADIIGISAGFDNHRKDWGGLLTERDYYDMGTMVRNAAQRIGGGCFGILEGGYNHSVLGYNTGALIDGLAGNEYDGRRRNRE